MDATSLSTQAAPLLPDWMVAAFPWLAAAILLALVAIGAGVWRLVARAARLEELAGRLDALEEARDVLARVAAGGQDVELRRIEHLLAEVRDGLKRLEDALLRVAERPAAEPLLAGSTPGLVERVTNRLLALGYERVVVLNPRDELERMEGGDGEVLVEARRAGAQCKGRVLVRSGALADVDVRTAHAIFP